MLKFAVVLLVLLSLVELAENNDKYCKCNLLHVLCNKGVSNPSKKQIKDKVQSMDKRKRKAVTKGLNFLRNSVAEGSSIFPYASNMLKLEYSEPLERAARMQVINCNPWTGFKQTHEWCNHKCHKCTDIDGLEVHFSKSFTRTSRKKDGISTLLSDFLKPPEAYVYDVSVNYKLPTPRHAPSEFYEIQYMALQAEYSKVGCSYTTFLGTDDKYLYYTMICAFGPVTQGMLDRPPYKVGTQCCNCPINTKCRDDKSDSLCEYEEGKSFNRTEGIGENGGFCKKTKPSGGSTTEDIHVPGGDDASENTINIPNEQSKKKDIHDASSEKEDCRTINLNFS